VSLLLKRVLNGIKDFLLKTLETAFINLFTIGFFVGVMFIVFSIVFPIPLFSFVGSVQGQIVSDYASDDEKVIDIASLCEKKDTDLEKIQCVNYVVKGLMKYEVKGEFDYVSPTEFLNSTGDCFTSATTYCSVFKNMDIECTIISFPTNVEKNFTGHAFSLVRYLDINNSAYCVVDQTTLRCW